MIVEIRTVNHPVKRTYKNVYQVFTHDGLYVIVQEVKSQKNRLRIPIKAIIEIEELNV